MKLILSSVGISAAVFMFCIVLLGARNPRHPRWAADMLIGNLYCPLMVAIGLMGLSIFGQSLYSHWVEGGSQLHLLTSMVVLALTFIGVKTMRIKKRLAAYQAQPEIPPLELKKQTGAIAVKQSEEVL